MLGIDLQEVIVLVPLVAIYLLASVTLVPYVASVPGSGQRRKQPYYFHLKGGKLFAFAGLYTPPHPEESTPAPFAIITTIANEVPAQSHRHTPVLLDPSDERRWLNPFFVTPTDVLRCLLPLRAECMEAYPAVNPAVLAQEWADGPVSWSLSVPRRRKARHDEFKFEGKGMAQRRARFTAGGFIQAM